MRNIGGSDRHLDRGQRCSSRNTQVNHAAIAAHVTAVQPALHEPAVTSYWNAWTAAGRPRSNAVVTEQAEIIAYADDYRLMMFLTLAAMPTLLLMRRPGGPAGGAAAHAAVPD